MSRDEWGEMLAKEGAEGGFSAMWAGYPEDVLEAAAAWMGHGEDAEEREPLAARTDMDMKNMRNYFRKVARRKFSAD